MTLISVVDTRLRLQQLINFFGFSARCDRAMALRKARSRALQKGRNNVREAVLISFLTRISREKYIPPTPLRKIGNKCLERFGYSPRRYCTIGQALKMPCIDEIGIIGGKPPAYPHESCYSMVRQEAERIDYADHSAAINRWKKRKAGPLKTNGSYERRLLAARLGE